MRHKRLRFLSLTHPSPLAQHTETWSTQLTTIRCLQEKGLLGKPLLLNVLPLRRFHILFALFRQRADVLWAFWVVDFMGGQFHVNIGFFIFSFITDFPEAWHDAVCCKVDIERDAALLNNPSGVVSPFLCLGPMLLRLCGMSAGG